MVTIFTPVYNRAYIIENLYHSLQRQTSYDFEWLIVDDGSTDNIAELVHQWRTEINSFNISFYQQKNRGKHCAINRGVALAKGEAFFIVDSDDYLEDDAVETILAYWGGICDRQEMAGISGLRRHTNGKVIGGTPYFSEYVDSTNFDREKYGLDGDKAEVYKTEILRKFPFPEYKNEWFITESVVWDRIAYEGYKLRWINKSFEICEYRPDGLTAKGGRVYIDNPKGWAHYMRLQKKSGIIEYNDYLKCCFHFYENERTKFTNKEFEELLDITPFEFNMILSPYIEFMQRLSDICDNKRICIYAYGNWGKKLKEYFDELKINVDYVIDKQFKKIKGIKAYSIDMVLPQIDVVFIALKDGVEDVVDTLKEKMPETEIVLYRDIKPYLRDMKDIR